MILWKYKFNYRILHNSQLRLGTFHDFRKNGQIEIKTVKSYLTGKYYSFFFLE